MINIISQSGKTTTYLKEFVIDTPEDVANLPTDVPVGSTALCIQDGEVYIFGGDGQWHTVG
jgi:hypothetical protein